MTRTVGSSALASHVSPRPKPAKAELRGERPAYRQPGWLCAAVSDTVNLARGLAETIADRMQCPVGHVHDLADPLRRVALKAYEITPLVQGAEDFRVLDEIERDNDRVAFKLPTVHPQHGDLKQELAGAMTDFGGFLKVAAASLAEHRITPEANVEFSKAADALIARVCVLKALHADRSGATR